MRSGLLGEFFSSVGWGGGVLMVGDRMLVSLEWKGTSGMGWEWTESFEAVVERESRIDDLLDILAELKRE